MIEKGPEQNKPAPSPSTYLLNGRVIRANGDPAPLGMEVHDSRGDAGEPLAICDAAGEFIVTLRSGQHPLHAVQDGWTTVRTGIAEEREGWTATIVVAPALQVEGRVTDEGGIAIQGAKLKVEWTPASFLIPRKALRTSVARELVTLTSADGTFQLDEAGFVAGTQIAVSATGFIEQKVSLPESSSSDLLIRLERPGSRPHAAYAVTGVVLHGDGSPAEGAAVRLGPSKARTKKNGRFRLRAGRTVAENTPLIATLDGFQPALIESFPLQLRSGDGFAEETVLRLGEAERRIRGKVVTRRGEPCVGWKVGLWDPTVVDPSRVTSLFVENMSSAADHPSLVLAQTDDAGHFEVGGLLNRSYELVVWQEARLQVVRLPGCVPGEGPFTVLVPDDELDREAHGRLVSMVGSPLAGVQLTPTIPHSSTEHSAFVLDWMVVKGAPVCLLYTSDAADEL
ncbi:MAG: carboxypeptidase-like regulatory domain-containing protein, partial [Gammaproteobacteria bacterium]|nr:carboxypeptidase-like regulatory domain-containing protein [Gammaproteobacteria bacterium]